MLTGHCYDLHFITYVAVFANGNVFCFPKAKYCNRNHPGFLCAYYKYSVIISSLPIGYYWVSARYWLVLFITCSLLIGVIYYKFAIDWLLFIIILLLIGCIYYCLPLIGCYSLLSRYATEITTLWHCQWTTKKCRKSSKVLVSLYISGHCLAWSCAPYCL